MLLKLSLILIAISFLMSSRLPEEFSPESGRFWIFFDNKGDITDSDLAEFKSQISERSLQRRLRARAEDDLVTIKDMPIKAEYIEAVEQEGLTIHRKSRWMNAVSVFADRYGELSHLLEYKFVTAIEPVATHKRPLVEFESDKSVKSPSESHFDLDYGPSDIQIKMIGMDAVHRMGFNGEGVILGVFDTGFRTSHQAFRHAEVLAEWDFVDDDSTTSEPDWSTNHGTSTWSAAAGLFPGQLYGPGFGVDIILARTEDITDEYIGEEDNWAVAMEWAESLGVDIVTSSLGYRDWYVPADMDGMTGITTRAAADAAAMGILVVNAVGNSGFGVTTIVAPADADSIIAVGAVSADSSLASFSSRGPTADGRIKPELCARGMATRCARSGSDFDLGTGTGTSLATPLISGASAALLQAHPYLGPLDIIEMLKRNAHKKDDPDNNFGWGIPNFSAAIRTVGDTLLMLPIYRGWNMISNPFTDTLDFTHFPEMFSAAWSYNTIEKQYYIVDRLAPGQACFLPHYTDTILYITGELSDSLFQPVHPGWNMVGATGKASFQGEYFVIPDTAFDTRNIYFYDAKERTYVDERILFPGEARWIFIRDHGSFFAR